MVIDSHYHLETRMQPVENLIKKMDQNGIDKTVLIATLADPISAPDELLLKLLRLLLYNKPLRGLAKKLVANFLPEGDIILSKQVIKIYPDPDNKSVAKVMGDHPDRFLGWIFVNARGKNDSLQEYEKWKDTPGFIGVKAHPFWHQFAPIELLPLAEKLEKSSKPMLLHLGYNSHGDFISLIEKVPKLKLVLAHTGFPHFEDTWKLIKDRDNILVDVSADAYVNEKMTQRAIKELGADRVLFGSDGPYGHKADDNLFDNGLIKRRIEKLFSDPEIRKRVFESNFQKLIQN